MLLENSGGQLSSIPDWLGSQRPRLYHPWRAPTCPMSTIRTA